MIVTDKEYFLDNYLIEYCDRAIKRREKKWDNLWIYDGDEGNGKTTLAVGQCYYLAHQLKKTFTVDNIFFDLEKMIDFAARTEGQVILWDEAALGGLGGQHMDKAQKKLIQALMVGRKKRHMWVFCIPKFYELKRYIVRRAVGLVHVYTENNMNRGRFTYYRKKPMNIVYNKISQSKIKDETPYKNYYTFPAKFSDYTKVNMIDWDAYEDKKDKAIMQAFSSENKKNESFKMKIAKMATFYNLPKEECAKLIGVPRSTFYDWCVKLKIEEDSEFQNPSITYRQGEESGDPTQIRRSGG